MTLPLDGLIAECSWCHGLFAALDLQEISVSLIAVDESDQKHIRLGYACERCAPKVVKQAEAITVEPARKKAR